jgi:hypothetical protein
MADIVRDMNVTRQVLGAILASATLAAQAGCAAERGNEPAPGFAETGVIEGFYGPPWSHQDRIDVLRFMGRVGLTTYYYAPKDDPYHRGRWRESYPPDELDQLRELVAVAKESGVRFVYAISPGGSMVYSDAAEYASLLEKLGAIADLGATRFALFLDDVPPTLEHGADRMAFGTLADAHADLINRLYHDLGTRGATLAVTPTTYTNAWGDREYLERLGELAAVDVPFFWTGIDVASPEITTSQAREWAALIGRPPLIWDNYPVNDYARWRPFLGPLVGRERRLGLGALGILSNPMNEAHASMIPLATLAAYTNDPAGYDPEAALEQSLNDLYGQQGAVLVRPFVELYGDYGWDQNLFEPLFIPGAPIDIAETETGLGKLEAALALLDSAAASSPELAALAQELGPFVSRTRERFQQLMDDPSYARRDGALHLRVEVRHAAETATPIHVDGNLEEWLDAEWESLTRARGPDGPRPQIALRTDGSVIYLALRVPGEPTDVRTGNRVGEGSHIGLVIQSDPREVRNYMTPEDLVVILTPPTESQPPASLVRSMALEGFMAKFLGDNRALTFSEFLLSTLAIEPSRAVAAMADGLEYGAQRTSRGYGAEIALPLAGFDRLRLSLTVAGRSEGRRSVHALGPLSYPANPATFAELALSDTSPE